MYHIPMNDTTFALSVFWPSDTKRRINEPMFSNAVHVKLFLKRRLTSVAQTVYDPRSVEDDRMKRWERSGSVAECLFEAEGPRV